MHRFLSLGRIPARFHTACGWIRIGSFATRFLGHDELYSFYIAQAPTLKQLFFLTRTVDLHPPLSYLMIRLSFTLFGTSAWACRLPFLLAFLLATAILFSFVCRLLSPLYGLIAILCIWTVPYTHYAAEARPYSLVLCFTSLMLVSWYRCISSAERPLGRRRGALLTLVAAEFGLLLSHVLGVFSVAAFAGAEFTRLVIRRKPDWSLWTAFAIPGASVLIYLPLIHSASGILFTDEYRATPIRLVNFYGEFLRWLPIPLAFVLLLSLLWPVIRKQAAEDTPRDIADVAAPAALRSLKFLLLFFSIVPLGIGVLFSLTGVAFFERYGIVFLIPVALGPALLLAIRTRRNQVAAALTAFLIIAALGLNTFGRTWLIEQVSGVPPKAVKWILCLVSLPMVRAPFFPPPPAHLVGALAAAGPIHDLDRVNPELPLVANTGLTFLEVDHEGDDSLTARLYLLNDTNAATEIAHDTVFENYARLKQVFPIRGRVEPFCDFIGRHTRFLVLGDYYHPQGWLLKRLDRSWADLHVLGTYNGHTTEEGQLYEVVLNGAMCPSQSRISEPNPTAQPVR